MTGQPIPWASDRDARAAALDAGETKVASWLAWASESRRRASLLLVALCLALFLPGFFQVPVVDRDEARYVQTTKHMVESGDYIDLTFHEQARYKKPIGIYWLQAAAVTLSGQGEDAPVWVYRLVSLIGATLAVVLTFFVGRGIAGPQAGFVAAVFLAACIIVNAEARLAKTDAALLACVVACQLALSRLYLRRPWHADGAVETFRGWPLVFWAAMGVGILIKGPIAPMVSGSTVIVLAIIDRGAPWLRRLRPLYGALLVAAIVLPWLIAITIVSEGRFFAESLGQDLLGKVVEGQQSHGAPPGAHFLVLWFIIWPAGGILAASIPAIWRHRREAALRFLLAWILPTFLLFELVATKLPHYTLPTYPAIVLLAAGTLVAGQTAQDKSWARLLVATSGLGGILTAIVAVFALGYLEAVWSPLAIVMALVVTVLGALTMRAAAHGLFIKAAAFLLACGWLVSSLVFGVVTPQLKTVWMAPRLAAALRSAAGCEDPEVISAGYREGSLIFEIGSSRMRFGDGETAAVFLAGEGCRAAVVSDSQFERFVMRAKAQGYVPQIAETVSGINIGNSRWQTYQIATRAR